MPGPVAWRHPRKKQFIRVKWTFSVFSLSDRRLTIKIMLTRFDIQPTLRTDKRDKGLA